MKMLKDLEPGTKFKPVATNLWYIALRPTPSDYNKIPVFCVNTYCLFAFSTELLVEQYEKVSIN